MSNENPAVRIKSPKQILLEFQELRSRLEEAEQTLEAIRAGDVDALVVYGDQGEKVYTLKGADEPYRIFVEQMNEGALTLDGSGGVLYCNQSFARMADIPSEKIIGSSALKLLFDLQGNTIEDFIKECAPTNRAEMIVLRPHGELPVLVSCAQIETEGAPVFLLTVTDLSAQRESEAQLRKANAELEGFCYSVSHDLRAPLRNITGGAHIIMEDYGAQLPDGARADLQTISNSAAHLGKLIDDLLLYSRLDRLPLDFQEINLSALAQDVADDLQAHQDNQTDWRILPGLKVQGDPRLIRFVVENLMSNAAKYSSKVDHPIVEIGSIPWDDGEAIFVRDNGIGFEMTYVDQIFKPFERLHRQSEYPGTGIGLASAGRIVACHGGDIWAESQPDKGATFFFHIPVRDLSDPNSQPVKVSSSTGEPLRPVPKEIALHE